MQSNNELPDNHGTASDRATRDLEKTRFSGIGRRKLLVIVVLTVLALGWMQDCFQQLILLTRLKKTGIVAAFDRGNVVRVFFLRGQVSFGDNDLPQLKGFRHLRSLDLSDTQVTKAAVLDVKHFLNLRELLVLVPQIDKDSERELVTAMPKLAIGKLWLIDGMKVADGFQGDSFP